MADYENKSTPEVQRLARQGDKYALYEMVWRLELLGSDNPSERCAWQDYWFEKAADSGHVEAKFQYAVSLIQRVMNAEDRQKAMKYFQSLSDDFDAGKLLGQDDRDSGMIAKLRLGMMLCEGYYTERNAIKGVALIKAAEKLLNGFDCFGFDFLYKLGELYATGLVQPGEEPTIADLDQAIRYLDTSIKCFNPEKENPQKLDLVKQLLENSKKWETKKHIGGNNTTFSGASERREKMMKISDAARQRMETDKAALKRLRERLNREGWNIIVEQERQNQYNELIVKKRRAFAEAEFNQLAKNFRDIGGYRDSTALAEECEKLAMAAKDEVYEKLLLIKQQFDKENEPNIFEYRKLAENFSKMGTGYKDASKLATDCFRVAFAQEQKNQYNHLLSRMRNADNENDFKVLSAEFRAMGDYEETKTLANKCEARYHELKSEHIHIKYTNASTTLQRLKKNKTRKPEKLRKQAEEYERLACEFMANADYKDAFILAKECTQKSEMMYEKAKRIENLKTKYSRIVGLTLQTGVFLTFLYILLWSEILPDSMREIISITLSNNNPNIIDLLLLIGPLFYYALTIGFLSSLFLKKGKRFNYLFYIAAIIIQTIIYAIWIKEYRGGTLPIEGIVYFIIFFTIIIIPGAIAGKIKRRPATITIITVLVITLTTRHGYYSGWFDDTNYQEVKEYADGMAAVKFGNFLNRKWGFIDESGKEVIPCNYSEVIFFSEELAAVKDKKWGFIDKDGNEIVPFKYDAAGSFTEGLAAVRTGNEKNGKWGFIDKKGTEIIPCKYNTVRMFNDGLAAVNNDGWCFIDKKGNEVISLIEYDFVRSFSDGYARVGKRERDNDGRNWINNWGLIDKRGNLIVPCEYMKIGNFEKGLAKVEKWGGGKVPGKGTTSTSTGMINKSGKEVIPCVNFSLIIKEDIIEVTTMKGETQYFDKSGNKVKR